MDINTYKKKNKSPNVQYSKQNTLLPPKKNALFYPRSLFLLQFLPTPWVLRTKKFNLRLANTIRPSLASHQKFHSGWWVFQPNPSETYAIVKIGNHLPPIFGVKIPKIFELPPPSCINSCFSFPLKRVVGWSLLGGELYICYKRSHLFYGSMDLQVSKIEGCFRVT